MPSPLSPNYSSRPSTPSSSSPSDRTSQYTAPLTPTPEPSPIDSPAPGVRKASQAWSIFAGHAKPTKNRRDTGDGPDGVVSDKEESCKSDSAKSEASGIGGLSNGGYERRRGTRWRDYAGSGSSASEGSYGGYDESDGSASARYARTPGISPHTPCSASLRGSFYSVTYDDAAQQGRYNAQTRRPLVRSRGHASAGGSDRDTYQSSTDNDRQGRTSKRRQASYRSGSSRSRSASASSRGSRSSLARRRDSEDDSEYSDADLAPSSSDVEPRYKARKTSRSGSGSERSLSQVVEASQSEDDVSPRADQHVRPRDRLVGNAKHHHGPKSYGKSRLEILQDAALSRRTDQMAPVAPLPKAPTSQKPLLRGELSGPQEVTFAAPLASLSSQIKAAQSSSQLSGESSSAKGQKAVSYQLSDFVPVDINRDGLAKADSGRIILDAPVEADGDANKTKAESGTSRQRGMGGALGDVDPASIPLPRGSMDSGSQTQDDTKSDIEKGGEASKRDESKRREAERKVTADHARVDVVKATKRSSASKGARNGIESRPSSDRDAKRKGSKTRARGAREVDSRTGGVETQQRAVDRAPRTPRSAAHRAARIAVLAIAPLILALPIALQTYLTSLLFTPIFGSLSHSSSPAPSSASFPTALDKVHLALAALCSLIIWNATRVRGIKKSISVKVCLCLIALSADVVATSGCRLAGVLAGVGMAGTTPSRPTGLSGLAVLVFKGVIVEKAGLVAMGLLSLGGLVGGSAFAAVCYDHIHVRPLANEWPAHVFRSTLFTLQVVAVHKALAWCLSESTSILVQRPEQSILLISLLLTLLALTLSESEPPTRSFARTLHHTIATHLSLSPRSSSTLWRCCSRLPQGTFPLFLLLRLPIIVIALRQQVFLRPSPPFTADAAGVRILSSERGQTGLVVVGESVKQRVRWLRRDDGIVGGRWARHVGGNVTLGDTLTVPLVEAALLVDKPSSADSIARTISLTTDLQFPEDDEDSLGLDRRALVIGIGAGISLSTLHNQGYTVDAVEPEPLIYHAAIDHFNVTAPDSINIMDGWAFVQSIAALREEEAFARAERNRAQDGTAAGEGGGVRDMLVGMSPVREEKAPRRKTWWGDGGDEEEDEDEREENGMDVEGESAKWGLVWMEGRSVELLADPHTARAAKKEDIDGFWREVRMMVQDDGVLALDTSGIVRLRSTASSLLAAFEQCRGFGEARRFEALSQASPHLHAKLAPAVIICTPSTLPLTFRRPLPSDVRRSPIRAVMYDAFLRHEVALDEYAASLGLGTNGNDTGAAVDLESAELAEGMREGRWRDRKQVDLMRALDHLLMVSPARLAVE